MFQRRPRKFLRNTARPPCSVSITLPHDRKKRLDQYLDVEPKAPIIDVPQIKLYTLCDAFDRRRLASCSVALCPTGDARLDVMAKGVIAQNTFEIVVVCQRMWARSNQRHFTPQNIQDLGQLIDTCRSQQPSKWVSLAHHHGSPV